jgi:hypothetical protein
MIIHIELDLSAPDGTMPGAVANLIIGAVERMRGVSIDGCISWSEEKSKLAAVPTSIDYEDGLLIRQKGMAVARQAVATNPETAA